MRMFVMYVCFAISIVMSVITIYQYCKNFDEWKYSAFACMFSLMIAIFNGIYIIIDKVV